MNRMLPLLVALSLTGLAHGAVYKWKDANGIVHYGDHPQPGAEEVKQIPIQTYRPTPVPPTRPATGGSGDTPLRYGPISFVSPANDTTIRDNQGNVAIQLSIEPTLRAGHAITLNIDGTRQDQTTTKTTFTLSNLERGTHTLQAIVVDDQGNELRRSDTLTVHMVRQSELFEQQDSNQPKQEGPIQQAPRAPQAPRFKPDPKKSNF